MYLEISNKVKRNIFLVFLLVGIILMEYGCWQACGKEYRYRTDNITLVNGDFSAPLPFGDIIFLFQKTSSEISALSISTNYSALACEESYDISVNPIDSISVLVDREYTKGAGLLLDSADFKTNLGERFSSDYSNGELWFSRGDEAFEISFNTPPTQTDTFQFTFQFFDTKGNVFETTTEPIIITP